MGNRDYDRYSILRKGDGRVEQPPFIKLPKNLSDKYITWNDGDSRLDRLSYKYYGNPFYDFLILYANSKYLCEFDIPDGALIRIPFPLSKVISDYEQLTTIEISK